MSKVAIVASAPMQADQSALIDACDVVIRFNECKNYGGNSGRKVDILCITNTGAPARRICQATLIRNSSFYGLFSEVWFPRDSQVHRRYVEAMNPPFRGRDFEDLSELILSSNDLSRVRIVRFSSELNDRAFRILLGESRQPFFYPSTGFLAMEHVFHDPRFERDEKFIFGFSFQGWRGHPWQAEQEVVLRQLSSREDIRFIPP